jgi:4-oxalocrotonate tautomerase
MPLIQAKFIEGELSAANKRRVIEKLTDAVLSVTGEKMRPATWVIIEEVKSGDWGIAGKAVTLEDARALAAGKAKS